MFSWPITSIMVLLLEKTPLPKFYGWMLTPVRGRDTKQQAFKAEKETGKKDKLVPINSEIRPILSRLLKANPGSPYVFVNPRTGDRFGAIQNSWNGILKKAGLTNT